MCGTLDPSTFAGGGGQGKTGDERQHAAEKRHKKTPRWEREQADPPAKAAAGKKRRAKTAYTDAPRLAVSPESPTPLANGRQSRPSAPQTRCGCIAPRRLSTLPHPSKGDAAAHTVDDGPASTPLTHPPASPTTTTPPSVARPRTQHPPRQCLIPYSPSPPPAPPSPTRRWYVTTIHPPQAPSTRHPPCPLLLHLRRARPARPAQTHAPAWRPARAP